MTRPSECTAAQLASLLDALGQSGTTTGWASMLDEAALPFMRHSAEVASASRAFSAARYALMRSYSTATEDYSPDAWNQLFDAGRELARALRPLGELVIARCPQCGVSLREDGTCGMADLMHTPSAEGAAS